MDPGGAPLPRAYWADPGRLLAGPYPAEYDALETRRNLQRLVDSGIRTFINLMQAREEGPAGGRSPYVKVLEEIAVRHGIEFEWLRFEIHDMSIPDEAHMDRIQAAIENSLEQSRPVYAHCWGGRGRTGTVVGAYLIGRGLATPQNFVDVIGGLRAVQGSSPETAEQVDFVRRYASSRSRVRS